MSRYDYTVLWGQRTEQIRILVVSCSSRCDLNSPALQNAEFLMCNDLGCHVGRRQTILVDCSSVVNVVVVVVLLSSSVSSICLLLVLNCV